MLQKLQTLNMSTIIDAQNIQMLLCSPLPISINLLFPSSYSWSWWEQSVLPSSQTLTDLCIRFCFSSPLNPLRFFLVDSLWLRQGMILTITRTTQYIMIIPYKSYKYSTTRSWDIILTRISDLLYRIKDHFQTCCILKGVNDDHFPLRKQTNSIVPKIGVWLRDLLL